MKRAELIKSLTKTNSTKIVLAIMDGLGDLPDSSKNGMTPLERAKTPNIDKLAPLSELGLSIPIEYGITPGSGPAHMSLFGYDPVQHLIGRGALAAFGVGFHMQQGDVAARINFAHFEDGVIKDRRAGRPSNDVCKKCCDLLQSNIPAIDDVTLFIRPVKEHRAVVIFRGAGLGELCNDSDPQLNGKAPLKVEGKDAASAKTARLAMQFIQRASQVLKGQDPVNFVMLRGFAIAPAMEGFKQLYQLNATGIAAYPMYKGVARIAGMNVSDEPVDYESEIEYLTKVWNDYDFFFIHFKKTDSAGEDGNFDEKQHQIELIDGHIGQIMELKPDVIAITGDHSTPASMAGHSWHPVPLLIYSKNARADRISDFSEYGCRSGSLGQLNARYIMTLLLAHAGRLAKFGS